MAGLEQSIFLPDPDATDAFGARLAGLLQPGDIIALNGELGTGKTALARAVIRTLTQKPELDVPSPSFALVQPYTAGDMEILHADLYRLADAREIEELGLLENSQAIVLVEWAERAPELVARASLTITLDLGNKGTGRTAKVHLTDAARATAARLDPN